MANQEQLERLKQGVFGWSKWREENQDTEIDLRKADLGRADLVGANLAKANLKEANLEGARLGCANLEKANFEGTRLMRANLEKADLQYANLWGTHLGEATLLGAYLERGNLGKADLGKADLRKASLGWTNLEGANLEGANLEGADLQGANLQGAKLMEANLGRAILTQTILGDVDLSKTKGLEDVKHGGPSPISTSTLERSKGKIPEAFLRGCGLSDWEIESAKLYQPGLSAKEVNDIVYRIYDLRANQAIQINPLFISYSHADDAFVNEMEKLLDEKGIRFWRDIHDATAGRLEKVVDRAIRQNPIVLLILSEHSVKSDWVEHEARTARELEKELGRDVLCPVALDDAWKTSPWDAALREQIMKYNILNFSKWEDEAEFTKMFQKLVDGLDLFYKEPK